MATATANLPALSSNLSPEGNLSRYLSDIRKFPLLEPQEEFMLAKRWREHGDSKAICASWRRSPWAIAATACRSQS
jgi:RNA polymerase sigma-32 factor